MYKYNFSYENSPAFSSIRLYFSTFRSMFAAAFHIPPDFDDTFVNIGLGSLLKEIPSFTDLFQKWQSANSNLTSALNALKHYAYRPHSNISRVNTIDPRTYFYLHKFLEETKKTNAAFVPTWVWYLFLKWSVISANTHIYKIYNFSLNFVIWLTNFNDENSFNRLISELYAEWWFFLSRLLLKRKRIYWVRIRRNVFRFRMWRKR